MVVHAVGLRDSAKVKKQSSSKETLQKERGYSVDNVEGIPLQHGHRKPLVVSPICVSHQQAPSLREGIAS